MSLVVTGTDTEVGKTVTAAVLAARYGAATGLAYWKPVATGGGPGSDRATVAALAGVPVITESYLLNAPLSPHLAARREGIEIRPRQIVERFRELRAEAPARPLLIEGVGGLLVPLTDSGFLLADLLVELGLPCVVVARSTLGTINHTLLTLEALRRRSLPVAGVVINGPPSPDNEDALARFGAVEIVSRLPPVDPLDRVAVEHLAAGFDPAGRLQPYLSAA